MNLSRALSYIFEDPDWGSKLVVVVALTFLSAVLMPLLFAGLVPLCLLLGYMVEIVSNVRNEHKIVLPRWVELEKMLARGSGVLLALFVYNIPFLIFSCCIFVSQGSFQDEAINGLAVLLTLCCVLPLALGYAMLSWSLLAAGMAEYARTGKSGDFFKVGKLWRKVEVHGSYTLQFLLATLIVNLVFIIVAPIPCIGWIAAPALLIPVLGHLVGQFAFHTDQIPRPRKR